MSFKETATDLNKIEKSIVKKWLDSFDNVLSDCDGVLWIGSNPIDKSAETINRLQELGKNVYFVTNNAEKTQAQYFEKAKNLGFNIAKDHIITSGSATVAYLKKINFNKKVYVIGRKGIVVELQNVNIACTEPDTQSMSMYHQDISLQALNLDPDVGAVLVNYDHEFNYGKLVKACNYLLDPNCLFLSTCLDEIIPTNSGVFIPGIKPIAQAIESCIHREVFNIGKPSPTICQMLLDDDKFIPQRTLMIGDNIQTDVALGKNCGFQTLMVASGVHKLKDIEQLRNSGNNYDKFSIPDTYSSKLGDLLEFL